MSVEAGLGVEVDVEAPLKEPAGTLDEEAAPQPANVSAVALASTTDMRDFFKLMSVQEFLS